MPQAGPELKKYLDKRLFVQLNGSRKVIGVLRGYDIFLNIVLDDAVEEKDKGEKVDIGSVIVQKGRTRPETRGNLVNIMLHFTDFTKLIRGNSVVMLEALERIGGPGGGHGGDRH